jgi:hypothetical protein
MAVHTPETLHMPGTDVPDINGDILTVEMDIPEVACTKAPVHTEEREGTSASDTLTDAGTQPVVSGSKREVKVSRQPAAYGALLITGP